MFDVGRSFRAAVFWRLDATSWSARTTGFQLIAMAIHIDDYSFGRIVIDGEVYGNDLIILPERVIPDWWRAQGHSLSPDDLEAVVTAAPARLIIGTGSFGMMRVPPETLAYLRDKGIETEVLKTKEACARFNELAAPGEIAAALHLTC